LLIDLLILHHKNKENDKVPVSTTQFPNVCHIKEIGIPCSSQAEETLTDKNLDAIWDQFKKETDPKSLKTPLQMNITKTPEVIGKTSLTGEAFNKSLDIDDLEVIPVYQIIEVVLKIEEILPLDMFYSPTYKVVVSRQRKRRRIEHTMSLVLGNASFELTWKDAQATPPEDLRRLS